MKRELSRDGTGNRTEREQRNDMTQDQIRQAILDIIADIAPDEDVTKVKGDVRLREQLDLDSMDFLDIVMELRKRYNVEVPEADYMQLASLDSSVAYLEPKMKEK
jgi:acyl carrier protein